MAVVPGSVSSWVSQALVSQVGAVSVESASNELFGLRSRQAAAGSNKAEHLAQGGRNGVSVSTASVDGIPTPALLAYRNAESILLTVKPSCGLTWSLLAGIGRVESDHGRYGGAVLDSDGRSEPAIIGLPLNGVGPVAAIPDTDGGRLDGDTTWDRAVGPLQFIPTTWDVVGSDGDGDDVSDPNDLDDAALAAAVYLCAGGDDLSTQAGAEAAVGRYNHSDEYVALVLAYARAYERGDLPADLEVPTPTPDVSSVPAVDEPVTQPEIGPALEENTSSAKKPRSQPGGGRPGNGGSSGSANGSTGNDGLTTGNGNNNGTGNGATSDPPKPPTMQDPKPPATQDLKPPATQDPKPPATQTPETPPEPDPTPTPKPPSTPDPDPTPTPKPPSTPDPKPTAPGPTDEPTSTPDPDPTPTPTPKPSPKPTPDPKPTAPGPTDEPTSTPDPKPKPSPKPTPTSEPTSEPTPDPEPETVSGTLQLRADGSWGLVDVGGEQTALLGLADLGETVELDGDGDPGPIAAELESLADTGAPSSPVIVAGLRAKEPDAPLTVQSIELAE